MHTSAAAVSTQADKQAKARTHGGEQGSREQRCRESTRGLWRASRFVQFANTQRPRRWRGVRPYLAEVHGGEALRRRVVVVDVVFARHVGLCVQVQVLRVVHLVRLRTRTTPRGTVDVWRQGARRVRDTDEAQRGRTEGTEAALGGLGHARCTTRSPAEAAASVRRTPLPRMPPAPPLPAALP